MINLEELKKEIYTSKFMTTFIVIFLKFHKQIVANYSYCNCVLF